MATKTPIIVALGLLVAGYVAYPCLALYRLDSAMARGDTASLRRLIDWPQVSAFIRTVAVKNTVTPEAVLAAMHATAGEPGENPMWLRAAWPEGPGRLVLDLGTVRLRLELERGVWEVTRAWLPADVLTHARSASRDARQG